MLQQKSRIRDILVEYQARLADLLGDDLEFVVLYGSQARG
ncbi:MAG: nucleotidyltransferase domain-containing protein, partial [Nitrospinota bacterium]